MQNKNSLKGSTEHIFFLLVFLGIYKVVRERWREDSKHLIQICDNPAAPPPLLAKCESAQLRVRILVKEGGWRGEMVG